MTDQPCICIDERPISPTYPSSIKSQGSAKWKLRRNVGGYDQPWGRWANNARLKFLATPSRRSTRGAFDDDLDFVLAASYRHEKELFPEKVDVFLQKSTVSEKVLAAVPVKRRTGAAAVAATITTPISEPTRLWDGDNYIEGPLPRMYIEGSPLIIGGRLKNVHPSSIKLMNSSHHSPQTNAGYVRQDRDGNLFQY